ncbi:MAG: glycosyltransferase family 2 protein, partial [Oscillospiraceae bacterium]
MEKPLVSILVPIYNGGQYLRRFLDSAILQTLDNIEIICVDDGSTDDSMDILEEYRKEYPEKLFVYKSTNHNGFSGTVRNQALGYARADYIFMCDQDDVIQVMAMELMYKEAVRYDADIIIGQYVFTLSDEDGNIKLKPSYTFESMHINNGAAILKGVEFFCRLIKKSLLEEIGPQPEDLLFHDVAYMPVIQSYARNIRLINWPVYYYYRRDDSISGTQSARVCKQSIAAERYALEHCNPKYLEYVEFLVAQRIISNMGFRWICADLFAEWIKEMMPRFESNSMICSNQKMLSQLEGFSRLDTAAFPQRVFLCAFDGRDVSQSAEELADSAFADGCEVAVLNPSCCDVRENPYISDAFDSGRFDIVEGYFAVKSIYEKGGIYLHDCVKVLNTFNYCKLFKGFFGYFDASNFTDKVFGAVMGNEAFGKILNTYSYSWDKRAEYMPLSERIKIILSAEYGITANGKTSAFKSPVSVFSPEMFAVDVRFNRQSVKSITSIELDPGLPENITLSRSTLRCLLSERKAVPAAGSGAAAKQPPSPRERRLARELGEIKNSNTWKIVMKL